MNPAGCRIGAAEHGGKSLVNGNATQYSALMNTGGQSAGFPHMRGDGAKAVPAGV